MRLAPAVAQAAIDSGVARIELDMEAYLDQLAGRMGKSVQVMRAMEHKAQQDPKRVVFAEGEHPKVIRAAYAVATQGIASPILLGRADAVADQCEELGLDYRPSVVDPTQAEKRGQYAEVYYRGDSAKASRSLLPTMCYASPITLAR